MARRLLNAMAPFTNDPALYNENDAPATFPVGTSFPLLTDASAAPPSPFTRWMRTDDGGGSISNEGKAFTAAAYFWQLVYIRIEGTLPNPMNQYAFSLSGMRLYITYVSSNTLNIGLL